MVHDALSGDKAVPRWRKAFRATTQKCLLGAVMGATGTRAIYYTVQVFIFIVVSLEGGEERSRCYL